MRCRLFGFAVLVITTSAAFASGFRITAHGARAMGMGLAFTAVADDASAIYFNPAGLAFFDKSDFVGGGVVARNIEGEFTSSAGVTEQQQKSDVLVPELYWGGTLHGLHVGLGAFGSFGLPMRWENPSTFSGRHAAYLATIRSLDISPVIAFSITKNLSIGAGADWVHSKVQLEQVRGTSIPVAPGVILQRDIAVAKLKGDLADSSAWGWNAGLLWKDQDDRWRFGVSYRSSIDVDHDTMLTFTQILTGIPTVDTNVRASLPTTPLDANVPIQLPSSLNVGLAYKPSGRFTIAFEADRTDWSSFQELDVTVPANANFNFTRVNHWKDTWAYRVGVETLCGPIVCRVGYYRDQTPQPNVNVGPILADANRQALTAGIGFGPSNGGWSIDIADVYVRFDDRSTDASSQDNLVGTWKTTGNEFSINLHIR
ncbi:MAG: hypothetical protein DMF56_24440 [Acidobacteria bacterium]|nr:MAG: hypothetical protein DMF56_24440 [Acidobacteriota bacterium]